MKTFKNPAPLEYEIENVKGEKSVITTIAATESVVKEIQKVALKIKDDEFANIRAQLGIIFNLPSKFFLDYQVGLLTNLLMTVVKDINSPSKTQK